MPRFDDEWLCQALGDELVSIGGAIGTYEGLTIDSRQVQSQNLFVALKGERVDGHDYIEAAIANGATGILCQDDLSTPLVSQCRIFRVRDSLKALRTLAKAWRARLSCPVLAVAGSVGKTTSKELLVALMQGRFQRVGATQASENGFIGIPLTLLRLPLDTELAVIEIGIDEAGAMAQHLEVVRPTAGLVTAIAPEHLEKLRDMATVAYEEGLCLHWLASHEGLLALNLDDPELAKLQDALAEKAKDRLFTYSLETRADQSSSHHMQGTIKAEGSQTLLELDGLGLQTCVLKVPLAGRHNAGNLLGVSCLARALGLQAEELASGLASFQAPEGRTVTATLGKDIQVICDYYNASPASMQAAFQTASDLVSHDPSHQLIACLGDMLELGEGEESYHRKLASGLINHSFSRVLLFGERMRWLEDELIKQKFTEVTRYGSQAELAQALRPMLRPGTCVLIKGSRGMRMEQVWASLGKLDI